jgi:hypothetical protein
VARLEDLDNQSDQHGRVHEKMKDRLKKMDDHAQEQGQQVDSAFIAICLRNQYIHHYYKIMLFKAYDRLIVVM